MENDRSASESAERNSDSRTQQKPLLKIEKFNLIVAVVGLIADFIGISTFLAGVLIFDKIGASPGYVLFKMCSALVFVYGWFVLAWVLTKKSLNRIERSFRRYRSLYTIAGSSTTGVGLFLLPIAIIWYIAFVTQNDILLFVPFYILALAFCGLSIFIGLVVLMSSVYDDLSLESQKIAFQIYIEGNWHNWKKRIEFELSRYKWIDAESLRDMADVEGVPLDWIDLVLARYASVCPSKARYGRLFKEVEQGVVDCQKIVLANRGSDLGDYFVK